MTRKGNNIELNVDIDTIKNRISKAIGDYYKTIDNLSSLLPWEKVQFVKKSHQPKGDFKTFPFIFKNKYCLIGAVKFTDADIFQNDNSWHKVSGLAFIHPHSNSIRLAYKAVSKKIHLAHYIYKNGERYITPIGYVKLNQTVYYKFIYSNKKVSLVTINSSLPGSAGIVKSILDVPSRVSIVLNAYHGGKIKPSKPYNIHKYEQVKRNY